MSAKRADLSLSAAFRQRTLSLHSKAERSGIVADMLRGRVTRLGYALLLRNLLPAYSAMEAALEQKRHSPAFHRLANKAVYRAEAIERVLSVLYGPAWGETLPLLPSGQCYADRIAESATDDGSRLIAHIYARYLGDLYGGQILKRLLAKTLALDSAALSFFDFPEITDMDRFKADYRAAIDLSAHEIPDIGPVIEEAATAFTFNIHVSEAVQRTLVFTQNVPGSIEADSAQLPAAC